MNQTANDLIIVRIGQRNKIMLEVIVSVLNDSDTKIKEKLLNGNRNSINITSMLHNGLSLKQLKKCVDMTTALSWDFGTEIIVLFRQMGINESSNKSRKYASLIREQYMKQLIWSNETTTPSKVTGVNNKNVIV